MKQSALWVRILVTIIVCYTAFPTAASAAVPLRCQHELWLNGGLDAETAMMFCSQNSSDQFVVCQHELWLRGGLSGVDAGSFCLQSSSNQFINCQHELWLHRGYQAVPAARACL